MCKHTLLFWCQGTSRLPPLRECFFLHFLKGFSKELDHLSLVDFFCIPELFKKKSPIYIYMYSHMNCLIENEYIRELSLQKKNTYVFPNELPNWKRIHKGTFPPKKKTMYSQMNCLIENEYIRELSLQEKNTYVFPNELPNWKRILMGKKRKKTGKKSWRTLLRGVLLLWTGSWRTLLWGGLLTPCWH